MLGYINGNTAINQVSETEGDQRTLKAFSFLGMAAAGINLIRPNRMFGFKGNSMNDFFNYVAQKVEIFGNAEAKEIMAVAQSYYCLQSNVENDMNSVISQFCLGVIIYHTEGLGKFQSRWHFIIKDGLGRKYNNNTVYVKER